MTAALAPTPREQASPDLADVVAAVGRLLPNQGPIGVFIAQNPLQPWQHLHYHEAIGASTAAFGTRGYLPEVAFRAHYRKGRIRGEDLDAALAERWRAAAPVAGSVLGLDACAVQRLSMFHPITRDTLASLTWRVEENDATHALRADLDAHDRQRLVRHGREEFDLMLASLGNSRSYLEIASELTGVPLATQHAARLRGPPRWRLFPQSVHGALDEMGLHGASADAYLAYVRARVGADAERWIAEEVAVTLPLLARTFGRTGSVRDLRELAVADPERVVTTWLWGVARTTPPRPRAATPQASEFPTDRLRALCQEDTDGLVNDALIPWVAAFLDEGLSDWPMPLRANGFYAGWRAHILRSSAPVEPWMRALPARLARFEGLDATTALAATLDEIGVAPEARGAFLTAVARPMAGWSGMMHHLQRFPDHQPAGAPPSALVDFLAVRLQYDVLAWTWTARSKLAYGGPPSAVLNHLRSLGPARGPAHHDLVDAWQLFHLAQIAGITPLRLAAASTSDRRWLLDRLGEFGPEARSQVWFHAYERAYREPVLSGIADNRARRGAWLSRDGEAPAAQVLFCMDDREEALRRHVEELLPSTETFGLAGFFGISMDFRGLDEPAAGPLCPVVNTPAHHVDEVACDGHQHAAETRGERRAHLARARRWLRAATRGMLTGGVIAATTGLFVLLPLAARVFAPRLAGALERRALARILPAPETRLSDLAQGLHTPSGKSIGFTIDEQVTRVRATLRSIGLTRGFAPYVVLLGHGSASVNNPHRSAYDCGACGGRPGGPSARIFAIMANRPEVRAGLRAHGIDVPDTTRFVAGAHNTATEAIDFFDLDPAVTSDPEWRSLAAALEVARRSSAHERCRRFASAPRDPTLDEALAHVAGRAEDLAEARPELGHATNALCVVGRRALTRGLFLDRRAFLVSYDPEIDPDGDLLGQALAAAGPVGAGINLAYNFSCIDNLRHGAGSKLPHNVTGLVGVMDGAGSDLRTGLPRQMVELHEPMRLLMVCEATPATLARVLEREPRVAELVTNGWVQLVSVHPSTGEMQRFIPGQGFDRWAAPPTSTTATATRSLAWYRWHDGSLPPALIAAGGDRPPGYAEPVHPGNNRQGSP